MMIWMLRTFGLILVSLLVGCTTVHEQLVLNPNMSTEQRMELLQEEITAPQFYRRSISLEHETCVTILECAIYLDDYDLAKWILESSNHPKTYTGQWGFEYKLIYAPLRAGFSDAKTNKYLSLMLSHGFDPNVCDYGSVTPIAFAFKKGFMQSYQTLLAASKNLNEATMCADVKRYTDYLFSSDLSRERLRELVDSAMFKSYSNSALAQLIKYYSETKKHHSEMLFLLLEVMEHPDKIRSTTRYRCDVYSRDSALAYANCHEQDQVVSLLTSYYLSSEKFSETQRRSIFISADYHIGETLSESELREKNRRIDRKNKEYEANLRALFDAADSSEDSSGTYVQFQSVSEMLEAGTTHNVTSLLGTGNSQAISSAVKNTKSNMTQFDFHLYADNVGVESKKEKEKTYFVGETCKKYPWASSCQDSTQKTESVPKDEYWSDYSVPYCGGVMVKGKPPTNPPKPKGNVCVE